MTSFAHRIEMARMEMAAGPMDEVAQIAILEPYGRAVMEAMQPWRDDPLYAELFGTQPHAMEVCRGHGWVGISLGQLLHKDSARVGIGAHMQCSSIGAELVMVFETTDPTTGLRTTDGCTYICPTPRIAAEYYFRALVRYSAGLQAHG